MNTTMNNDPISVLIVEDKVRIRNRFGMVNTRCRCGPFEKISSRSLRPKSSDRIRSHEGQQQRYLTIS